MPRLLQGRLLVSARPPSFLVSAIGRCRLMEATYFSKTIKDRNGVEKVDEGRLVGLLVIDSYRLCQAVEGVAFLHHDDQTYSLQLFACRALIVPLIDERRHSADFLEACVAESFEVFGDSDTSGDAVAERVHFYSAVSLEVYFGQEHPESRVSVGVESYDVRVVVASLAAVFEHVLASVLDRLSA